MWKLFSVWKQKKVDPTSKQRSHLITLHTTKRGFAPVKTVTSFELVVTWTDPLSWIHKRPGLTGSEPVITNHLPIGWTQKDPFTTGISNNTESNIQVTHPAAEHGFFMEGYFSCTFIQGNEHAFFPRLIYSQQGFDHRSLHGQTFVRLTLCCHEHCCYRIKLYRNFITW